MSTTIDTFEDHQLPTLERVQSPVKPAGRVKFLKFPGAVSPQHGREYYFDNIERVNKINFAPPKDADPFKNGFVPFSQIKKPTMEARVQSYMKKLCSEEQASAD